MSRRRLIFWKLVRYYFDVNGGADENGAKEKETENSVSQSGCSYTPVIVHQVI